MGGIQWTDERSTPKSEPIGSTSQALEVDGALVLTIPAGKIPVALPNGKSFEIAISGSLTLNSAHLNFNPSFDIGMQIDPSGVKNVPPHCSTCCGVETGCY